MWCTFTTLTRAPCCQQGVSRKQNNTPTDADVFIMSPHIGGALSINVRLSIRLLHQWLKCHSMQGNAVPVPPVIEIQRSHTSNFIKRSLAHNHLFGGGGGGQN